MIKQVYNAFGPERLMWATDCPYQVVDNSYQQSIHDLILHEPRLLVFRRQPRLDPAEDCRTGVLLEVSHARSAWERTASEALPRLPVRS